MYSGGHTIKNISSYIGIYKHHIFTKIKFNYFYKTMSSFEELLSKRKCSNQQDKNFSPNTPINLSLIY